MVDELINLKGPKTRRHLQVDLRLWDNFYSRWKPITEVISGALTHRADLSIDTMQLVLPGDHSLSPVFASTGEVGAPVTVEVNGVFWSGHITKATRSRERSGEELWELEVSSDDKHLHRLVMPFYEDIRKERNYIHLSRNDSRDDGSLHMYPVIGDYWTALTSAAAQAAYFADLPLYVGRLSSEEEAELPRVEILVQPGQTVGEIFSALAEPANATIQARMLLPGQQIELRRPDDLWRERVEQAFSPTVTNWYESRYQQGYYPNAFDIGQHIPLSRTLHYYRGRDSTEEELRPLAGFAKRFDLASSLQRRPVRRETPGALKGPAIPFVPIKPGTPVASDPTSLQNLDREELKLLLGRDDIDEFIREVGYVYPDGNRLYNEKGEWVRYLAGYPLFSYMNCSEKKKKALAAFLYANRKNVFVAVQEKKETDKHIRFEDRFESFENYDFGDGDSLPEWLDALFSNVFTISMETEPQSRGDDVSTLTLTGRWFIHTSAVLTPPEELMFRSTGRGLANTLGHSLASCLTSHWVVIAETSCFTRVLPEASQNGK